MFKRLGKEQRLIDMLNQRYDQLLINLDDSVNELGSLGESLGSAALGDDRLNNDLLLEFEAYIEQRGLRIGRWKL